MEVGGSENSKRVEEEKNQDKKKNKKRTKKIKGAEKEFRN